MKATLTCITLGTMLVLSVSLASAQSGPQKPLVLDVFPGKIPGATGESKEDKITGDKPNRRVVAVSRPTLSVFRPAKDKDTGAAVIIAPGGGYSQLAWDHEGEDVAAWLNTIGVTGIVLKYRVPLAKGQPRDNVSSPHHQDAQRAMSLVRSKAKDWGLDPKRIGMLGFSAGGHLTAMTITNFGQRGYEEIDEVDKVSCRPDFAVLLYPAYLIQGDKLTAAIKVSKETPPTFFVHCGDDKIVAENSVLMYLALRKAGVLAEMHIYTTGGHGFGIRPGKQPTAQWPQRCADWMRTQGILKASN